MKAFLFLMNCALALEFVLGASTAWASQEWEEPAATRMSFPELNSLSDLPAQEAFARTQSVLDYFGVPTEPASQSLVDILAGKQTPKGMQDRLSLLDSDKKFLELSSLLEDRGGIQVLQVFQDLASKKTLDFSVPLAQSDSDIPASEVLNRIRSAARNDRLPLKGLRIALDPGHMGGEWDKLAGKYVHDGHGRTLSEGLMALQVALLLEESFKSLGAEVLVTHRGLRPVTDLKYESFDLKPFALKELRENSLEPWFRSLLAVAPSGPRLFKAFNENSNVKKIFSESMRWKYFFNGAELQSRVELLEEFSPDITLIIHFDTDEPAGDPVGMNPRGRDATKAYVPGAMSLSELSSREDRIHLAHHLLNQESWNESLKLGRAVVHRIKTDLGVGFDTSGGGNSKEVEPGIFARNLYISRKLHGSVVSYVECLYYNNPREFEAFSKAQTPLEIDGKNYPYSDRLAAVAGALRAAVLEYVGSHH